MMLERYGRYSVIREVERKHGARMMLCRCDCGTERVIYLKNLKSGNSTSCGCAGSESLSARNRKHGYAKTPTWHVWVSMRQRCSPAATGDNLKWYYNRGISVCDRWKDFSLFLADMGEKPDGFQIDRIDNNGNYEPGNCRWASPKENSRNRSNNTIIAHDGLSLTISEWAERKGWGRHVITNRIRYGWPIEDVLGRPLNSHLTPLNPSPGVNAGIEGGV